ncbi:hypothetical protein ACH5RR_036406 [Cinchona calisaya]|uniref:Leucine-rich repeat-containing N-terminal plant-type domain-containing protein n=1 Tax=Cinchona calisaya TaxID=153742 RepID=A0ABD2Y336_9GENT
MCQKKLIMKRTYDFLLLVAFVLHFLTTSSLTIANNNTHDLNALLAFKASIVFDPQNILSMNWSTSISVCNWIGITCNARHGRVATIHLPDMGLIGTIPPHLGNLSFLAKFNITNNAFQGELPKELANLRRLKYLVLAANNFVGSFPLWLGGLTELRFLSLRDNKFSGSLSRELSNATKLETIALANNALTGNLPEEFSYLKNLKYIHISDNKLSGSFQQALFNLSSLQVMAFANNSLSGYLPARICDQLPQLLALDLSWNEIQGEIPSGIGECSNLEFLGMSYNNIVGKIPRGIWNLTTLTTLYLGGLGIEGMYVGHFLAFEVRVNVNNLLTNFTCINS